MTSAISLRKYLNIQIKEKNWLTILISLVSFLALPVFTLMTLQSVSGRYFDPALPDHDGMLHNALQAEAFSALGIGNAFISLCVIIAAVMAAMVSFTWLYSKDKSDFYLGLAMGRKRQFQMHALSGALISVIPYVAATLAALFIICPVFGVLSARLIGTAFLTMAWRVLSFLAVYFVIIAALLLTGRYLPGVLIAIFFLGYGPCIVTLFLDLIRAFFNTYYTTFIDRQSLAMYLSPVTLGFSLSEAQSGREMTVIVAVMAVFAAAAYLVSCRLYVKRPAETAGASLTYPGIMSFLKVIVTIPCAVVTGIAAAELSGVGGLRSGWMIFGGILGAIVVGGIMEFIESSDLRSIVKHWKSALISVIGALVILTAFRFDIFGYDRFLPAKDKIKAMAVSEEAYIGAFGDYYKPGVSDRTGLTEIDLLNMGLTENYDEIYRLAEAGVNYADKPGTTIQADAGTFYTETVVLYELNSGRKVYRRYMVPNELLMDEMRVRSAQPEYCRTFDPFNYLNANGFDTLYAEVFELPDGTNLSVRLSPALREEFIRAIRSDTASLTAAQLYESQPVGVIWLSLENYPGNGEAVTENPFGELGNLNEIYIYPEYAGTIAFLKENGVSFDANRDLSRVTELSVEVGREVTDMYGNTGYEAYTYRITDPEEMQAMLNATRRVRRSENTGFAAYSLNYRLSTGMENSYTICVTDEAAFEDVIKNAAARQGITYVD